MPPPLPKTHSIRPPKKHEEKSALSGAAAIIELIFPSAFLSSQCESIRSILRDRLRFVCMGVDGGWDRGGEG